jgi:hypothetical protein
MPFQDVECLQASSGFKEIESFYPQHQEWLFSYLRKTSIDAGEGTSSGKPLGSAPRIFLIGIGKPLINSAALRCGGAVLFKLR